MSGQLTVVIVLVTAAAAYLLWGAWRTWAGRRGCAGGCGCRKEAAGKPSRPETFVPVHELRVRGRS